MIKNILVALDGSRFSECATRHAIDLAKIHGATVTGTGIIDVAGIERDSIYVPLGGSYYKKQLDEVRESQARERVETLLDVFEKTCAAEGVEVLRQVESGTPIKRIYLDSLFSDIVLLGLRTYFIFGSGDEGGSTLRDLVRETIRPVLAVPETCRPIKQILLATDFSPACSRLAYFLSHVPLYPEAEVHAISVVSDDDEIERGKELARQGELFLRTHGINFGSFKVEKGDPEERILAFAMETGADLVALGVHSKRTLHDRIFGSTLEHLIEKSGSALLMYQ
jgi:nucleotide-binding universal stress UspA family protein